MTNPEDALPPGADAYEYQLRFTAGDGPSANTGNHSAGTARGPVSARFRALEASSFQPSTTGEGKLPSGGNIIGLKYAIGAI